MSDELHVSESAGAYVLGALSAEDAHEVEFHTAMCEPCRQEILDLKRVVSVLPLASPSVEPSPDLKARILAAGKGEDQAGAILRRAVVTASKDEPKHDFWHRPFPAWAGLAGWMGLAAACAIAGMFIGVTGERHRILAALNAPAVSGALGKVAASEVARAPYAAYPADAIRIVSADQIQKKAVALIGQSQVWDLSVSKTGEHIPCTVIQPPHVDHAMLVSNMLEPAKEGMVYRVWLVRKGKAHKGPVVLPGRQVETNIPMRVQSGDVIAFSMEPKGGSALPPGPFVMEQTL